MQIICEQQSLSAALSLAARCVPSRPTHPILANILLTTGNDKLTITGFDLSLGISLDIDVKVEQSGSITAPAKLLLDVVTKLPAGEISLATEDDSEHGLSVKITPKTGGIYSIRAIAGEDFPQFPDVVNDDPVLIPAGLLLDGIAKTTFAASTDEAKAVLVGVHLLVNEAKDCMEMASTDGHRLSVVKLSSESELQPLEVTVPSRSLSELQRLLAKKESAASVEISIDEGMAKFKIGDSLLVTRTKEGQYPKYNQLIPTQFTRSFVCDRKQLTASLDRIGVLAAGGNLVLMEMDTITQSVTISCESPSVGAAKESMPVQASGTSISVAFNIKYLLEGLNAMNSKDVIFNLNEHLQPVIINPVGGTNMTYLCMPVQKRD